MYDTLLDDLEDDVTPSADEAVELVDTANAPQDLAAQPEMLNESEAASSGRKTAR